VYNELDPATSADLWILTLAKNAAAGVSAAAPPRPFLKTNFTEAFGRFSPDGHWIAYQSNESGRFEVYIRSFPDGERTLPVSVDGGIAPAWSRNGKDLYFRATNGRIMAVAVTLSPEPQLGKPRPLFDGSRYENRFEVAPDGQRLLMMPMVDTEGSATQVHVVLNFLAELRQRLR
jgi:Tol biopolymer transport system component